MSEHINGEGAFMSDIVVPSVNEPVEPYRVPVQFVLDKLVAAGESSDEALATLANMGLGDEQAKARVIRAADLVDTAAGMVPRDKLVVSTTTSEDVDAIYAACEFFLDGTLVRRDAWVNLKRGLSMGAEQATLQ